MKVAGNVHLTGQVTSRSSCQLVCDSDDLFPSSTVYLIECVLRVPEGMLIPKVLF